MSWFLFLAGFVVGFACHRLGYWNAKRRAIRLVRDHMVKHGASRELNHVALLLDHSL